MAPLTLSDIFVSVQERFKMRNKLLVLAFSALIASGCSSHQAVPSQGGAGPTTQGKGIDPYIRQTGEQPAQWRRFNWGGVNAPYYPTIVAGNDGNMWYTDYSDTQIIRMNMSGGTKRIALPSYNPTALTVGSDHKFYMGDVNLAAIEIATTGGSVSQNAIPSGDRVSYDGMALGPDGNVWFTENSHVGRIKTTGSIAEFAYSDGNISNTFGDITAGPDGNIWATEYNTSTIDKVTPTGAMTAFALGCNPTRIVSAAGSLWVSCTTNNIVQVSTSGTVVNQFYNGFGFSGSGNFMTIGGDKNPWFGTATGNIIGTFNPTNNSLTYYYPPINYGTTNSIALGPDGNMWTVDSSSKAIDIYIINVIAVNPPTLNFTGNGVTKTVVVTEKGTSSWTAASKNTGVATVAQGSPASNFKVTSVASGTTKIIISDAIGNSFAVLVTVQ